VILHIPEPRDDLHTLLLVLGRDLTEIGVQALVPLDQDQFHTGARSITRCLQHRSAEAGDPPV